MYTQIIISENNGYQGGFNVTLRSNNPDERQPSFRTDYPEKTVQRLSQWLGRSFAEYNAAQPEKHRRTV